MRAPPPEDLAGRLDRGRGPVATILVQRGTLKVGDPLVAGAAWGRVRALYDYRGEKLEHYKRIESLREVVLVALSASTR